MSKPSIPWVIVTQNHSCSCANCAYFLRINGTKTRFGGCDLRHLSLYPPFHIITCSDFLSLEVK